MMQTIAFRMNLNEGQVVEYKRRHDEVWPEITTLLKNTGVHDYSIFFDEETHHLFAVLKLKEGQEFDLNELDKQEIMHKWWEYMADIMETVEGGFRPVAIPLTSVFYMA